MKNGVKLSVIMPAYNTGDFIGEAIASVLSQSFSDFEFIIIDDGSTDHTAAVIRSYNDPRMVLFHLKRQGIAGALNFGLTKAKAAWIARFDADDVCYPDRLLRQYEFLQSHPDHIVVGSAADYMDRNGEIIFRHRAPALSSDGILRLKSSICPFIHSTVVYHRQTILDAGGYDRNAHGFEDHFLWLKVLKQGKSANMNEALVKVRLNPDSATIDEKWRDKQYIRLKQQILEEGSISESQGALLRMLDARQNNRFVKNGAYDALLGKKYLWNNQQPSVARIHFLRSWKTKPTFSVSLLLLLSFAPKTLVAFLYRLLKEELKLV